MRRPAVAIVEHGTEGDTTDGALRSAAMTWPGWGEVLPLVTGAVTLFAVLVGGMRALTRTVAEQASAAARDAAKEAFDDLYERLRANDFRHVEERIDGTVARIDQGLLDMGARIERVEARIGERLDRMGGHMDRMGGRLDRMGGRLDRMGARMERMEARLREETAAMEARILAAVQRRPEIDEIEA